MLFSFFCLMKCLRPIWVVTKWFVPFYDQHLHIIFSIGCSRLLQVCGVCVCVRAHAHACVSVCTYLCVCLCEYVYLYECMYLCMYTCVCLCVCVYACVNACLCVHALQTIDSSCPPQLLSAVWETGSFTESGSH